jgi:hypothetical protein
LISQAHKKVIDPGFKIAATEFAEFVDLFGGGRLPEDV